jgi:hypothetical protein
MNWEFVHRWYMPFVWITMSSLVAVPLAAYFEHGMEVHAGAQLGLAYGNTWVVRDDFLASIVPYLLGLGSVIWLFNADGSTRWAAFWALLAAIGRIVVPIALANMTEVSLASGQHYIDWHSMRILIWFQDFQMFAFGIMLWAAFGHFVGQTSSGSSRGAYAEAH